MMKVKVNLKPFEFEIDPDADAWKEADEDAKKLYVKERLEEYLKDNLDELAMDGYDVLESENKPSPELIAKIIEASNYIAKNTRRGTADHFLVPEYKIQDYAIRKGMTFDEAEEHLRRYFKGETDEF